MSAFYFVFLVLFSQTPATDTHEGFPELILLEKHSDVKACEKAIERIGLNAEQKEKVGCVRILKGNSVMVEA